MPDPMRIVALLTVRNEALVLQFPCDPVRLDARIGLSFADAAPPKPAVADP